MAQRHWLDPLARRLLLATGQLAPPPAPPSAPTAPSTPAAAAGQAGPGLADQLNGQLKPDQRPLEGQPLDREALDRESLERESLERELVERELLALKLSQNPALRLRDAAEVRHAAALGWRLDVNRATRADWLRLPGLSPAQGDLLLRLQAGGVQLSGPEDLKNLLELSQSQLAAWLPLLEFRWYGEAPTTSSSPPPLDLNRARPIDLLALGLSRERIRRLLRERARSPFLDLAELQQRLQLPPELVESWIGRVRFSQGPCGPVLPSPPRRP
jgi:DNA uptake protein ComE-like DNA-binding protein